jgi:hypothetical protein
MTRKSYSVFIGVTAGGEVLCDNDLAVFEEAGVTPSLIIPLWEYRQYGRGFKIAVENGAPVIKAGEDGDGLPGQP